MSSLLRKAFISKHCDCWQLIFWPWPKAHECTCETLILRFGRTVRRKLAIHKFYENSTQIYCCEKLNCLRGISIIGKWFARRALLRHFYRVGTQWAQNRPTTYEKLLRSAKKRGPVQWAELCLFTVYQSEQKCKGRSDELHGRKMAKS